MSDKLQALEQQLNDNVARQQPLHHELNELRNQYTELLDEYWREKYNLREGDKVRLRVPLKGTFNLGYGEYSYDHEFDAGDIFIIRWFNDLEHLDIESEGDDSDHIDDVRADQIERVE